jgi:hypothetical protein
VDNELKAKRSGAVPKQFTLLSSYPGIFLTMESVLRMKRPNELRCEKLSILLPRWDMPLPNNSPKIFGIP